MACEYFVNGDWVTENQLKELLNAGLLDTLISDGTIDIKGFKLDSAKVIKTETFTKKHEAIPASKLAKILANEVKTRQGYPQNMLSSLELNADGTDFKIPLWASPYKDKFESLLTSLVSNKVVKQKFPGNSYVLGSQEGFQVKEGDDTAGELKKSNVVFTSSFDPIKGLQPMRWDFENKKILPAQIMIPFKFRDENGAILSLKEFTIKGEDGRMLLDTTKLPEKLLQLFGFRIPTQERNSMAAVEIVGFLPEASGDLMLAPRDFTKQMGSDFDVDKLYTYMYNHFYKDGKIQTGFMSDKKKIAASLKIQTQHLEDLKEQLNLNKEDRKAIDAYIEEKINLNEAGEEIVSENAKKASEVIAEILSKESNKDLADALNNTFETISILKRSYKASRQNNIIDIHLRIMKSSNPEIINSIMALDSFGEFEGLASEINNSRNADKALPIILSDSYQRTKFINATAGKNGVGSFSLDSTFNATAQGKEITLENLTEETREALFGTFLDPRVPTTAELLENNLPLATFGEVESKGDISGKYTLKSQNLINKAKAEKRELTDKEKESLKFKSTIIRALQSTAVDNEKAQILDKLNINDETFDVIRALTLLGFEEKEIVGLITQEIIWEYVDKLRDARSSLTSYNPNAEKDIFTALAAKYDPKGTYQELNPSILEQMSSKSGEDLINNIKNKSLTIDPKDNTPDFNLEQLALLEKFQNLTEIGKNIKVLQSTINTESSGIPKSLLETESKVEQIQRLPYLQIFNAQKLLGEYSEGKLADPTTINGYASYYGTMFADQIFNEYFPYKNVGFKTIISEVRTHLPKGASMSMSKLVETQGEVFNEMRSYLYANTNTNLFGENPDVERRRLFIDSKKTATKPKNDSLATILNGLSTNPWFQKNGFLNKLSFDINKNGTISRINFEAAAGENFDERNIYDGFNYLLSKNFSVGRFNGIDYTSRMLAQELVAAAFLEGGKQGSKQYLKFVPTAYLKSLGFGEYLQGVPFDFVNTFYGNVAEDGPIYSQPSAFTRQYLQNNPDKTKTVSLSNLKGNIVASPEGSFTLNEEALKDNFVEVTDPNTGEPTLTQTHFLSIYDTKLPSKYALYEFDSVDRVYRRIPVLSGSYGFVGYNSQARNAMPAEIKNVVTSPLPQQGAPGYTISGVPVTPSKEFKINVVNNTAKKDTIADLGISRNLAGTAEALDDLLNNIETAEGVSTLNRQLLQIIRGLQLPENFNVTYNKTTSRGSYSASTGTLNINLNHPRNQDANGLAVVAAHELIHTFTAASIKAYQSGNIDGLSAKTIDAIQKLESLQKLYINQLIAKEGDEGLKEFQRLYTNFKEGRSTVFSPDTKNLPEYLSKYYGAIKLEEFVTMALTDIGFQEHLNSITDEAGISIWEQLKELLADLLNALGLDIKPGSALASTVKSTMDLIQANQETLKENNIDTKEFFEFGNSYKFQVDGNGKVLKAEYAQGNGILKAMNAKTGQKKYDALKNKPNTQGVPTIQPSTINTLSENIKNFVNSVIPNWINDKNNELQLVSEFKTIQLLVQEESSIKDRISFGEEAKTLIKEGLRGKDVFVGTTFKEQIPNLLYAVISGKLAKDGISEADMYSNIFKNTTQPSINIKEGVAELFKANPELAKIGTQEEYSQYLDGVFPNSKVKNILYHGTAAPNVIEQLTPQNDRIYFSDLTTASRYASWDQFNREQYEPGAATKLQSIAAIVNLENPTVLDGVNYTETETNKEGDGIIGTNITDPLGGIEDQILVRSAEQTLALGSAKDIKGFKEFVATKPTSVKPTIDTSREWSGDLKTRPIYTPEGVNTMRTEVANKNEHFGNPFSEAGYGNTRKVPTIQTAVQAYKDWLLTGYATWLDESGEAEDFAGNQEQRKWILDQINQGKLDSAILLYAGKSAARGQGMHPTALAEVVEQLRSTQLSTQQQAPVNTKYEIFPGVFANAGQTIAINKLKEFLNSDEKAFLLEGKGGTGKTTIIKQILSQVGDKRILAIAPSHKAKKVLAKSLKGINADIRTLASALAIKLDESTGKFEPDTFARDKGRVPIKNGQIIVIDESSMVSDELLSEIKKWVSQGAKVIFMGDRAQLPPVGQEKDSDVFGLKNSYTLTEKMRQAATSPIIGIGTKIAANAENNTSRVANPITSVDRVDMYDAVSGSSITWEKSEDTALTQFVEDVQQAKGDVNFAKIVTFNNQNHSSGQSVKNLNRKVRTKLFGDRATTEKFIPGEILTAYDSYNPNQGKEEVDIVFFNSEDMVVVSSEFSPEYLVNVNVYSGAKGTRNKNYKFDVDLLTLKDDAGKIVSQNGNPVKIPIIAESSKEEYAATLKQLWNTDRQLAYALQAKFGNLEYGYALTSHKAQGSTYTNVYVMEDNIMGSSNAGSNKAKNQSLYVAVSRPTTKLVMVSNKNTGKVEAPTGLNLSVLGNLGIDYSTIPTSSYGEDEGNRNENRPSDDDWDAYQKMMGENELLGDFTFDSEEFKNYLLICGK
jgi:hypothetical protein